VHRRLPTRGSPGVWPEQHAAGAVGRSGHGRSGRSGSWAGIAVRLSVWAMGMGDPRGRHGGRARIAFDSGSLSDPIRLHSALPSDGALASERRAALFL
jgi:hypothetical protein